MISSRIYEYRFKDINQAKKNMVWKEIAGYLFEKYLNKPRKILDPAGGFCEFINNIPSEEKYTIDLNEEFVRRNAKAGVKVIVGNNLTCRLPGENFDAVFISNFLEHLDSQENISTLLTRMYSVLKINGRIAVMGPNFKFSFRKYFDFADHKIALSEISVAEHLYGAGFGIVKIIPRFIPLSFRSGSHFPLNPFMIRSYFRIPILWKIFGKQFLVIGEKQGN